MKIIDREFMNDRDYDLFIISREIMATKNIPRALYNLECSEELLDFVNSINNQGIESIDCKSLSYVFNNQRFSMHEMGTAEQLFVISYYAVKTNTKICIANAYRHLRGDVLKLYIDWLKEHDTLDCITLITAGSEDKFILEGVI